MTRRVQTTGDPGLEAMADLQARIKVNIGARHLYTGKDRAKLGEIYNRRYTLPGGVPLPRTGGGPDKPPPPPPGTEDKKGDERDDADNYQSITLTGGELGGSADSGLWVPPDRDIQLPGILPRAPKAELRGIPYHAVLLTTVNSVAGIVLGPFKGPAVFQDFNFSQGSGDATQQDFDKSVRVDFSRTNSLDTFTHVASLTPTGTSTAEQTLFRDSSIIDYIGIAGELARPGWISIRPIAAAESVGWHNLGFQINLDVFYLKFYISRDAGTIEYRLWGSLLVP